MTHLKALNECFDIVAELDCILSLAKASKSNNFTFPIIVESKYSTLKIIGGRNPFFDSDSFVPNDFSLNNSKVEDTTIIVSGPNMGGKVIIIYLVFI